ncbi:hypothetical protein [Pseudoalteromonas sp. KS88]|uniref:hypothetical protein n=1 Tax=Pseudoalteromonas sp. KS88 TaxID=2109918 RepID=UPI00108041BA|nr:hypothetical protein [Pseudoalteromonas sp. KS88]
MQKIISLVLILLTRSGKREKTTFVVFIGTFVQSHGSSELPASATVHVPDKQGITDLATIKNNYHVN